MISMNEAVRVATPLFIADTVTSNRHPVPEALSEYMAHLATDKPERMAFQRELERAVRIREQELVAESFNNASDCVPVEWDESWTSEEPPW